LFVYLLIYLLTYLLAYLLQRRFCVILRAGRTAYRLCDPSSRPRTLTYN